MIDLTPLDVRNKRGDFKKTLRGYDPLEVDGFLELVAERMEELVKANLTLEERASRLGEQVVSLGGRERAVNEALVTAQQLRDEIRDQAQREAEQIRREAERDSAQLRRDAERDVEQLRKDMEQLRKDSEREAEQFRREAERDVEHARKEAELRAREALAAAERQVEERRHALAEMETQRLRFLESYRQLLQRQIDLVQVEEKRSPLDDVAVELDLGGSWTPSRPPAHEPYDPEAEAAAAAALFDEETVVDEPEAALGGEPEDEEVDEPPVAVLDAAAEGHGTASGWDDDDAMPVEGLAPSPEELESDATILPDPRADVHILARRVAGERAGG